LKHKERAFRPLIKKIACTTSLWKSQDRGDTAEREEGKLSRVGALLCNPAHWGEESGEKSRPKNRETFRNNLKNQGSKGHELTARKIEKTVMGSKVPQQQVYDLKVLLLRGGGIRRC